MNGDDDIREPHLRKPDSGSGRDFLGAFALVERAGTLLMTKNLRRIGGVERHTWDLPGGQVEPGELLHETLLRELDEETGLRVPTDAQPPEFSFLQEGARIRAGQRVHAWRSFFFRVHEWEGEPAAGREVLEVDWFSREQILASVDDVPYHGTFYEWLRKGEPIGFCGHAAWIDD